MSTLPNAQLYAQLMTKTLDDYKVRCDNVLNKEIYADYLSEINTALQQNLAKGGIKVVEIDNVRQYYIARGSKYEKYDNLQCIQPEIIQHKIIDDLIKQGYLGSFYTRDKLYISAGNEYKRDFANKDQNLKHIVPDVHKNIYYMDRARWNFHPNDKLIQYLSEAEQTRLGQSHTPYTHDAESVNSEGLLTIYDRNGIGKKFTSNIRTVIDTIL